ncbi:FHA domain-containing protein [Bifidobacterium xylocopae]|uniref:FHA domain-containing protein n=1 Tax=Bifidobacterium xylocopae TaxID=2493119 RepID=UPI001F20305A|nr:FHA domain-containing protein [Bifidobacterium xylocopae]
MVTINGVEKIRLSPGQSIEIGRKPLRPLPDDGMIRLEVQDQTKSMSKRHASFIVDKSGRARLRDLGSTNGSYVVQDDGDLIRIPEDTDYALQHSAERFQFGDVLVDFALAVRPADNAGDDGQKQSDPVPDLFSYAQADDQRETVPDESNMSVDDILDMRAGEPTGVFHAEGVRSRIDALHDQVVNQRQRQAEQADPTRRPKDTQNQSADQDEQPRSGDESRNRSDSEPEPQYIDASGDSRKESDDQDAAGSQLQFQPLGAAQLEQEGRQAQTAAEARPAADDDQHRTYKPAFEPGSVFEKVSKGDFAQDEQVVEVDGMTSDDAKNSTDFSLQFEMAKHTQLLPFLAMNPSLYDDLYAWLSAQGDEDIDAALDKNEGYREYLAAAQE